jgi:hypothetical protein
MRKTLGLVRIAALAVPILAAGVSSAGEAGCKTTYKTCFDARTGSPRICQTTICYDKDGKETSNDTIILKQENTGGMKWVKPRGKGEDKR